MAWEIEKVSDYIINWLDAYVKHSPLEGFIVGVSGGIDSAVVATLCARTGKKTFLLNLPIRQKNKEYERAKHLIETLEHSFEEVKGLEISLDATFQSLVQSLPNDTTNDQLSMANTRARLRMTTLYAVGQANKLLVVGTGNKIEDFGIGFYTKYGDGGVDINPIGDLMKSEVYELAKFLGVDEAIITAKPTDGLWDEDDHNDEDQIGATYPELEKAMLFKGDETHLSEREKEVLRIYRRLHAINQHKFNPIPICDLTSFRPLNSITIHD